jgi:tripartite-type tricarboxylate transporter receptor subunit TctC
LSSWYGAAPAGTPAVIVNKLQQEISKIFKAADLREKLLAQGVEPLAMHRGVHAALAAR